MQEAFLCEHHIGEWQIRDVEGGVVNVGQSWQERRPPDDTADGGDGAARGPGLPADGSPPYHPLPSNLGALVAQVQWLQRRVQELERNVAHTAGCTMSLPQKMEFKIQKLYVRELTGTLNIGVTSIQDGPIQWTVPQAQLTEEDAADWRRLEEEGDQDWCTDV